MFSVLCISFSIEAVKLRAIQEEEEEERRKIAAAVSAKTEKRATATEDGVLDFLFFEKYHNSFSV